MNKYKKTFIFIISLSIIILFLAIIDKAYIKNTEALDFTNVDILTRSNLDAMNPDRPVKYINNRKVNSINGKCSKFKIYNSVDALKAIYALQNIISVCDINDLKFYKEHHDVFTDTYTFKQYFNGIEVVDGSIDVLVDSDTKEAYIVNSSIYYTTDFETTYEISKRKAKAIIKNNKKYKNNKITNIELVIYHNTLSWYIETNNFDNPYLYLDANTGDIFYIAQVEAVS